MRAESVSLRRDLEQVKTNLQELELARNTAETQLEGTGAQIETLTGERDEERDLLRARNEELGEATRKLAQAEEARGNLAGQLAERTAERDAARGQLDDVNAELGKNAARLAEVEADHTARQEELESYRSELEERFKGIAANVTQSTREDFIKEFRDLTKQQAESSIELVGNTVKPLRESLEKLDKGAQEMEKTRENAYADLRRSLLQSNIAIGELRQEASGLRQALRSPQVRGLWGEQQLQNVLEASGLREHVDFGQQVSSGSARPDVVVQIPGQRSVVIDAKTPLDSYLNALEADDQKAEHELLVAHANSLFNHARSLGQKEYAQQIDDALDFVILFVPSDAILDAALRVRPDLFEQAWRQHRVLMAAPGSLIAFLRAVAQVWQQQTIQQNAVEIAGAAHELYDRLSTYTDHLERMGRSLGQTVAHYNRGVGSFQSRVLSSARRIEDLSDIEESRRINDPEPVESEIRQVTAPELEAMKSSAVSETALEDTEPKQASAQGIAGYQEDPELETLLEALRESSSSSTELEILGDDEDDHRATTGAEEPAPSVQPAQTSRKWSQQPTGYVLWDETHNATTWLDLLTGVAEHLYDRHSHDYQRVLGVQGRTRQYFAREPGTLFRPRRIANSEYWLEANNSAIRSFEITKSLLEQFGYSSNDLEVLFE